MASQKDVLRSLTLDGGRSREKVSESTDSDSLFRTIVSNSSTNQSSRSVRRSIAYDTYFKNATKYITPNNKKYTDIFHANNIYFPSETDYFGKRYRYGVLNAYENLSTCREYLFFTKPDLNIMKRNDKDGKVSSDDLAIPLMPRPFWQELFLKYPEVIGCLQASFDYQKSSKCPFNNLLGNMVNSVLTVPDLTADMVDAPSNLYGVSYSYRGSSEASNHNNQFTLEFKDTKDLIVYHFFKAYEEYEQLKHHGTIAPWKKYIKNKILDDQYAIYKFIVGEDGETIIYYGKYYGVKSKNLPRDIFNSTTFDDGVKFSVDFEAAFYEDMDYSIISDFNRISYGYFTSFKDGYEMGPYNHILDRIDNRPAKAAVVVREESGSSRLYVSGVWANGNEVYIDDYYGRPHDKAPGKYVYKLKWRGTDAY